MLKTIFHGSNKIIEKPLFGYGKAYNDYGLGFYCTENIDMSKEWGASKYSDGFANIYQINTDDLTIFNLNNGVYSILHWLTVLLENRTFTTDTTLAQEAKDYLLESFEIKVHDVNILMWKEIDDNVVMCILFKF